MAAKTRIDILGFEYDWLACDAADHVGFFSTAGAGFAPAEFLLDTDAHERAIETLLAMPASTSALFYSEIADESMNRWRLLAERGLFAFDCNPNGGPYILDAAPKVPVHIGSLPASVRDVVRRIQFRSVRLAESRTLDPSAEADLP